MLAWFIFALRYDVRWLAVKKVTKVTLEDGALYPIRDHVAWVPGNRRVALTRFDGTLIRIDARKLAIISTASKTYEGVSNGLKSDDTQKKKFCRFFSKGSGNEI